MSTQPVQKLTVPEYLALERTSEGKHQFYDGEVFSMGGASKAHNTIALNIGSELRGIFRDRDCVAYVNDMRVKVSDTGLYTYPDVIATCLNPKFDDDQLDTLTNPQVIIEVLSESTESYDRGRKFKFYREIETLSDYVLVAQDRISVEAFTREVDGSWKMRPYDSLSDSIEIASIDCSLRVEDVYLKVEFD